MVFRETEEQHNLYESEDACQDGGDDGEDQGGDHHAPGEKLGFNSCRDFLLTLQMSAKSLYLVFVTAPPIAKPPETNQGTEAKRAKVGSPAISSLARSIRRATDPQRMWPIPSHLGKVSIDQPCAWSS